jgi:DNA-binding GntR family transcriptional regulator
MPAPLNPSSFGIIHSSIQDIVVDGIRDMILNGHLKPADRLRQDELTDTFGVSTMETLTCYWAAEDFDRISIDRLKILLEKLEAAEANSDDFYRRLRLVRKFFFTVFEASGREHLLHILSNLWDLSQQYRLYFYSLPELDSQRLANYRNIYQACCDRDAEALISAFRVIWAVRDHTLVPLVREEESKRQTT